MIVTAVLESPLTVLPDGSVALTRYVTLEPAVRPLSMKPMLGWFQKVDAAFVV